LTVAKRITQQTQVTVGELISQHTKLTNR